MLIRSTLLTAALGLGILQAAAEPVDDAVADLEGFLDEFEGPVPGLAVVVVTADAPLLVRTDGVKRVETGEPLTPETPMYIASQTKAFMGLLAVRLDREGVLDLETTLAEAWPELTLPGDLAASDWTLRDLLSHQVPIEADDLVNLEAYTTEIRAEDYPALVKAFGQPRDPGFRYDNLGYNIYAAILEHRTGRSWREWLADGVLKPLDLAHSSSRTSDFETDEPSWSHQWRGEIVTPAWLEFPPKPDPLMHSAGGLVVSPADMASWLQFQLGHPPPAGSGLSTDMSLITQESIVDAYGPGVPTPYHVDCTGYGLGWTACRYQDQPVLIHGGAYIGSRSVMAVLPQSGTAIAAMANSDSQTGWLTAEIVLQFMDYLSGDPDAAEKAKARLSTHASRVESQHEGRVERYRADRADEKWGGWNWSPDAETLSAYAGTYSTGQPYHDLSVEVDDASHLRLGRGAVSYVAQPARPGLFAVCERFDRPCKTVEFVRNDEGVVTSVDFAGVSFQRSD